MSYPASTKTLQQWVSEIDTRATALKNAAQQQVTLSMNNQLSMDYIRQFFDVLVSANVFFTSAGGITGIAAYANTEKQGVVSDAAAEFVAMRSQVVATMDWLRANVPQGAFGGTNYKLAFAFPADNVTPSSTLTFNSTQTSGYRTVLTSLIATIG